MSWSRRIDHRFNYLLLADEQPDLLTSHSSLSSKHEKGAAIAAPFSPIFACHI
jgi:hypothetical protein